MYCFQNFGRSQLKYEVKFEQIQTKFKLSVLLVNEIKNILFLIKEGCHFSQNDPADIPNSCQYV